MKVKDLAAMLLQCDPESNVSFEMYSGCCGDKEYMEISDVDFTDYSRKQDGSEITLRVFFHSLPGYESCIQVGGTMRAHEEYWKERNPSVLERIKNRKSL